MFRGVESGNARKAPRVVVRLWRSTTSESGLLWAETALPGSGLGRCEPLSGTQQALACLATFREIASPRRVARPPRPHPLRFAEGRSSRRRQTSDQVVGSGASP